MPVVWRTMKAIFSGVAWTRGDDQVALVLAIVIVGDDDDLAPLEGADGIGDPLHVGGHGNVHLLDAAFMVTRR